MEIFNTVALAALAIVPRDYTITLLVLGSLAVLNLLSAVIDRE